jgi:hypothetical protein
MNFSGVNINHLFRSLIIIAAALVAGGSLHAYGQSLSVCTTNVVDSTNDVWQTICINESNSSGTPQINGYVEVDTSNGAYLPAVDAEMTLGGTNSETGVSTFLGQADANPSLPNNSMELFDDVVVGVTVPMAPNTVYEVNAGFGECYDSTGNYGYNVAMDQTGYCAWTGYWANPTHNLGTNSFNPSVQVVSILYTPPGDKSTSGYTNATTNGTTTSVGSSFQQSYGIEFSGGTDFEVFNGGGSIGYKWTTQTGNTTSYQTTLTNQAGLTALANTRNQYNPNHLDMPNRLWDTFALLLNPLITTVSDDADNILGYSAGIRPIDSLGSETQADIVQPVATDMINGTIYQATLNPRPLPSVGGVTYYVPGLASICKNLIQSEYNNGTCTLADQCGCQKSDFSTVLAQDALLRWNSNSLTANPMPGYESPVDADTSGSACMNPNSSLSCRFIPVPVSSTNPAPQIVELNYANANSFTQTDSTSTSKTFQEQQSYTISLSEYFSWKIVANFKLTETNSWTWTDTESTGEINGTANAMNINLQTDNPGCDELNYVYEDTRYHTFVVQSPQNVSACLQ